MLHIFVDADACPVKKEVYRVADRYHLGVTLVSNSWMRVPDEPWISLKLVPGHFDAADDWIVDQAQVDDIIVTADILLASRCIKAGSHVIDPSGKPFTKDTIGDRVATRNLMSLLRETGDVTGGPRPLTQRDRSCFLQGLDNMIQSVRGNQPLDST